jgi:hypothetical protein
MKANEYLILSDCIERGVNAGWRRAFKHWDVPAEVAEWLEEHEDHIKDSIDIAVKNEICEYFKFEEPKAE